MMVMRSPLVAMFICWLALKTRGLRRDVVVVFPYVYQENIWVLMFMMS
jgi:hypothetical protein